MQESWNKEQVCIIYARDKEASEELWSFMTKFGSSRKKLELKVNKDMAMRCIIGVRQDGLSLSDENVDEMECLD